MENSVKKIGVFGLSANPIHNAHIEIVQHSLHKNIGKMDEVIVVPSWNHLFKEYETPYELRLQMCQVAFAGMSNVTVSDIAFSKKLSGTHWELMQELEKEYYLKYNINQEQVQFYIIVGGDVVVDIMSGNGSRANN